MNKLIILLSVIVLFYLPLAVSAQESTLIIGGQLGQFAPSDRRLQGRGMLYTAGQSGIDGAWEVIGFIGYRRGQMEYRVESGTRRHDHDNKPHYEGSYSYKARLYVYPITISAIYRFSKIEKGIVPYLGIGTGVYISQWREFNENGFDLPECIKGDAIHPGYHFLAGADYAMSKIHFMTELRYSIIYGDWDFTEQYDDSVREVSSLNIGGVSLRVGLGYEL